MSWSKAHEHTSPASSKNGFVNLKQVLNEGAKVSSKILSHNTEETSPVKESETIVAGALVNIDSEKEVSKEDTQRRRDVTFGDPAQIQKLGSTTSTGMV